MVNKNYLFDNYINMARNLKEDNNPLKALKFYKKAYDLPIGKNDIELIIDMALLYDQLGFRDYAKEKYKKVIEIDSNYANAYYGLAVIYDEEEKYEEAIKYYKKSIELNPNYDKAYFFIANIQDELGNKDEAIINYKKVIEINPRDLWAYANIGCILEEQNLDEEAIRFFREALNIEQDQFKVLFNMGVSLAKLGRNEEAEEYYLKSIKSNNKYPYSYLNLAVMYSEIRDYNNTINILNKGIENTEEDFLYYHRGCTFAKLNRFEEALADVNKSIELNDFFLEYSKKDKDLKEIWNEIDGNKS